MVQLVSTVLYRVSLCSFTSLSCGLRHNSAPFSSLPGYYFRPDSLAAVVITLDYFKVKSSEMEFEPETLQWPGTSPP